MGDQLRWRLVGPGAVALQGEADLATVAELERALGRAARSLDGDDVVVVDLSGVAFLDAAAVRVLVRSAGRLRDLGCRLRVVGATPPLVRVLELTGVADELGVGG